MRRPDLRLALACLLTLLASCAADEAAKAPLRGARLQSLELVLEAAQQVACTQHLAPIPATVIETGVFRNVPYQSFSNGVVELNAYGDPRDLVGLELGTQAADPALQGCLIQFIAAQALLEADRQRVLRASTQPSRDEQRGLVVEVTPPTADDAAGAWWISLERPDVISGAAVSEAQLQQVAQPQTQWAPPPPRRAVVVVPAVRYRPYRPPGPRVYVPRFQRRGGVYVRVL